MAMFRLAAQDIKYGNKEARRDARKFLKSEWFSELCENINLDSTMVQNVILKSTKISSRTSYE